MPTRDTNVHTGQPRTRTEIAAEWVVWHCGELAGVTGPAVLAATVNGWFGLASVAVAAGWITKEVRFRREQQQIRDQRALPPAPADQDTTDDETAGQVTEDAGEGQRDKGVSA
ncbi:hypothetical protein [Prauserella muralis]|uniref:Uncharacterized protein n=1 Tax=Prauserella muralis TaxID=588067 RepID=A0A2V4B944_9PSEU|nr:hypothetical protein [Prauserella muralis]PXY31686.1 hypothetical protein BAY60_04810 [Prauserella muralis]TWE13937.1 hypothetical protein FHX69_6070 [Prauserella muralis]